MCTHARVCTHAHTHTRNLLPLHTNKIFKNYNNAHVYIIIIHNSQNSSTHLWMNGSTKCGIYSLFKKGNSDISCNMNRSWSRDPCASEEGWKHHDNIVSLIVGNISNLETYFGSVTLPQDQACTHCSIWLASLLSRRSHPKLFSSAIFHIQSPCLSCPERRTLHGELPAQLHPLSITRCWQEMNGISRN